MIFFSNLGNAMPFANLDRSNSGAQMNFLESNCILVLPARSCRVQRPADDYTAPYISGRSRALPLLLLNYLLLTPLHFLNFCFLLFLPSTFLPRGQCHIEPAASTGKASGSCSHYLLRLTWLEQVVFHLFIHPWASDAPDLV